MPTLNSNIIIVENELKNHLKASEAYIHVKFTYQTKIWDGWVPVEYRRTGISIKSNDELYEHLNKVYEQMKPEKYDEWLKNQEKYWKEEKSGAKITKPFFDSLAKGGWQCIKCTLPENSNPTRRIQDLKEFGYTLSTNIKHYCPTCNKNNTHYLLLPIERCGNSGNGYETWSPALRKRIIKLLGSIDVFENVVSPHCLPDHKFSEIRWDDDTKGVNSDNMTDDEIRQKFQLLTNQRNQQKREVCRTCFQTGKRGTIFGIPYFYEGTEDWDSTIPPKGKEAERGCIGCAWYDIAKWRQSLKKLTVQTNSDTE
jgi:hypothetical protein